ncbi:ABC transporter permease [Planctomycetota bacterium]
MIERNESWWASIPVVFEFESRRAMTIPRMMWWCVLAFFPVAIILLLLTLPGSRDNTPEELWQFFLFCLVPMLISMLGTFMWTSSAISSELEGQSWIYLAVRPGGRMAVVFGKYLVAVAWVLPATLIGVTLSIVVLWVAGTELTAEGSVFETWFAITRLCFLSVPAYAAIYLVIGTIFTKRSMIVGVAYTLVFE